MANRQTAQSIPQDKICRPGAKPAVMSPLVVSSPGLWQESLRAAHQALPLLQLVGSPSGCLSALYTVRELKLALLVIGANLPAQDVQTLVKQVKREEGFRSSHHARLTPGMVATSKAQVYSPGPT
jgi:hypothetical protein